MASKVPSFRERLEEIVPMVDAPAFFGPSISFVLGPWLLLVLLLIGPAALLITLVLVAALAAALVVVLVALIGSPYLLVRHVRRRHQARPRPLPSVHRSASVAGGQIT
jgi:Flp pilus assembly protein TadB